MRTIVLASHGTLAAGMKSSIEMVVGEQERLYALCAYVEGGIADPAAALRGALEARADGDELVIVTDVLGGSVNNEAAQLVDNPGVFVVTGMNLPFVLTLVIDAVTPTQQLIDQSVAEARAQLMQVKPAPVATDEEDF